MIQSGMHVDDGQRIQTRVCIVGAGAAGVTLSLELAQHGVDVILLEAGALNATDVRNGDLEGAIVDTRHHAPLTECRGRQLGGTTGLWVGRCLPLDGIDFEERDYVRDSGWPFGFDELDGYYAKAGTYCHAGAYAYEVSEALPGAPASLVPGFADGDVSGCRIERWSLPTHFGRHYRRDLAGNKNIRVLVDAFCIDIERNPDSDAVRAVTVATGAGTRFRVEASVFVVAGGGLETTRLLLASSGGGDGGIGNAHGQLGRYYMGHLFGSIAEVQFSGDPRKTLYGFERDADGVYCRRRFWVTAQAQRREEILNTALWLANPPAADPAHRNGILSAAHLALSIPGLRDKLAPVAIRKAFRGQAGAQPFLPHLRNILTEFPRAVVQGSQFLLKRFIPKRRVPALFLYNRTNRYDLYYHAEQTPQPDNRVTLDTERDRFGMPRLRVDFRYQTQDIESVCRAHEIFSDQLQAQNLGTLEYKSDDIRAHVLTQACDGFHQLGTTRMSVRASDGVVDPACKVHGVENLYVCSSSVFPTSGQANPTLTIVALAIRLAEHLRPLLRTH